MGYVAENEHDEARFIADEIRELQKNNVAVPGRDDAVEIYR